MLMRVSTTSGEERDTDPANRGTINRAQLPAIRVSWQIGVEKSNPGLVP